MKTQQALSSKEDTSFINEAKNHLIYFLLYFIFIVLKYMPKFMFDPIASFLAFLRRKLSKKEVKTIRSNLRRVYNIEPGTKFTKEFERQIFFQQIIISLETFRIIANPSCVEILGFEEFQKQTRSIESGENGQIIIAGHLGSWELSGHFLAKASNKEFYALAKPASRKGISKFLDFLRGLLGMKIIWTNHPNLKQVMKDTLTHKNWLAFVMDQRPSKGKGPLVNFLDQETTFVAGPAMMAIKQQAAVMAIYCIRVGSFRYRLIAKPVLETSHGERDLSLVTQKMATELERVIRSHPEQWCWNYKRWKIQ